MELRIRAKELRCLHSLSCQNKSPTTDTSAKQKTYLPKPAILKKIYRLTTIISIKEQNDYFQTVINKLTLFFRPCKSCLVQERPGVACLAHTNTASQTHTHSRHTPHSGYRPLNISAETLWTCSPLKIDVLDFSVALQQSLPQAQSPSAYLCHF